MKIIFFFLFILNYCLFPRLEAQQLEVIKFKDLDQILHQQNDSIYVINFWATWCRPCLEELPDFEKARDTYVDKRVKFILISLDFLENKSRVEKFITHKKMKSKVVLLDETDYNILINKIDKQWSGAIPGTLFFRGVEKTFLGEKLSYDRLTEEIINYLN